jgi:hypothetical protein
MQGGFMTISSTQLAFNISQLPEDDLEELERLTNKLRDERFR